MSESFCSNNRNDAPIQFLNKEIKQANQWVACVPYPLAESPHAENYELVDLFSMVSLPKGEKQLFSWPNKGPPMTIPAIY